jgi:type IV secretion system protein VirB6
MYGIGTIFSMALLSVVCSIVLDLTVKIAEATWGAKIVNKILGTDTEGLSNLAMQQGGMGLLLTALIVSVPPMAAMFFQGTLGSFLTYSAFSGAGGAFGPNGQPAGSWSAHRLAPPPTSDVNKDKDSQAAGGFAGRQPGITHSPQLDQVKSAPPQHRTQ